MTSPACPAALFPGDPVRFTIGHVDVEDDVAVAVDAEEAQDLADPEGSEAGGFRQGLVSLTMQVKGKRPVSHPIARIGDIDGAGLQQVR